MDASLCLGSSYLANTAYLKSHGFLAIKNSGTDNNGTSSDQSLRGLLMACILISAFLAQVTVGPIIVPKMGGDKGSNI